MPRPTAFNALSLNGVSITTATGALKVSGVSVLTTASSLDSANLTGTIDIARLPALPGSNQIVVSTIDAINPSQEAQISTGIIVVTSDGRRWVYSGSGSKIEEGSYVILADTTPHWSSIVSKPSNIAAIEANSGSLVINGVDVRTGNLHANSIELLGSTFTISVSGLYLSDPDENTLMVFNGTDGISLGVGQGINFSQTNPVDIDTVLHSTGEGNITISSPVTGVFSLNVGDFPIFYDPSGGNAIIGSTSLENTLSIQSETLEFRFQGPLSFYQGGDLVLDINPAGVLVAEAVSAGSFSGDGSSLTNIVYNNLDSKPIKFWANSTALVAGLADFPGQIQSSPDGGVSIFGRTDSNHGTVTVFNDSVSFQGLQAQTFVLSVGSLTTTPTPPSVFWRKEGTSAVSGYSMIGNLDWYIPTGATGGSQHNVIEQLFTYGNNSGDSCYVITGTCTHRGRGILNTIVGFTSHLGNQTAIYSAGGGVVGQTISYLAQTPQSSASSTIGSSIAFLAEDQAATGIGTGYGFVQHGANTINLFEGQTKFYGPAIVYTNTGSLTISKDSNGGFIDFGITSGNKHMYIGNDNGAGAVSNTLFFREYTGSAFNTNMTLAEGGLLTVLRGAIQVNSPSGYMQIRAGNAGVVFDYTGPGNHHWYVGNDTIIGTIDNNFYFRVYDGSNSYDNFSLLEGGGFTVHRGTSTIGASGTGITQIRHGVATLTAGTVTVSDSTITANTRILLTAQSNSATGALRVSARTTNTNFTITSNNSGDTGSVAYMLIEP